jgi:iron complex outermembrane receptor protein
MNRFPAFTRTILATSVALSASALAQQEAATIVQEEAYDERTLEVVIVTAQKVSENLQNVPISVSLATAQDIADINAFNFKEIQEITPGIVFGGGAGLQSAAISIRGVGPEFFALGTPQGVAVFVDQVAQSQIGAVFSTMVDIKQVELLRGPQGTLYGRNAPGGAFNISTQDPNFDGFSGHVQGSYSSYESSDLTTQDVRAALNVPLIEDKLAWRVAAVYNDSDGFVKMVNPQATDDATGGQDNKAVRSKMLWSASDRLDVMWTANYQDLEQNPPGPNYDGLLPGTGGTAASPTPAIYNEFEDRRNYGENASVVTGDLKDTSLHLTWDTDRFQVDMIGFYQEFDTESDEVREPHPNAPPGVFNIVSDTDITTLELRLSDSGDRLDYVAGLYYFDTTVDGSTFVVEQGVDVNGMFDGETEGYAAFANVNLHLAPEWDLALGLRYDDVDDELASSTTFAGVTAAIDDKLSYDHVSWSIKLRNYISDDMTAYLAIDHAFKQGGFNGLVAGVQALNDGFGLPIPPLVAEAAEVSATYDEETSDAIELGIKGTFLDDRLRLGANIFYQRYEDHQVAQTNQTPEALAGNFGAFFLAAITNAEEVETQGIEADATYLIGEYWDVSLRAAYSDPTVDDWSSRFCPNGEESSPDQLYCPKGGGDDLNNLPKVNTNFQVGYKRPLQGGWDLYSRGTWTWQSAPSGTRLTNDFSESKSQFGLTIGASNADMGLDIKAWAKNLTDEDRNVDPGRKSNGDADLPQAWRGFHTPGRELGLTVRYNF